MGCRENTLKSGDGPQRKCEENKQIQKSYRQMKSLDTKKIGNYPNLGLAQYRKVMETKTGTFI